MSDTRVIAEAELEGEDRLRLRFTDGSEIVAEPFGEELGYTPNLIGLTVEVQPGDRTSDENVDGLTEAEMIALIQSWSINEFPNGTIDGEDSGDVLIRAEEKLEAKLPEGWRERLGRRESGGTIRELQAELNQIRRERMAP